AGPVTGVGGPVRGHSTAPAADGVVAPRSLVWRIAGAGTPVILHASRWSPRESACREWVGSGMMETIREPGRQFRLHSALRPPRPLPRTPELTSSSHPKESPVPKVALVTGGNRGIGLGITQALLAEGYAVAILATRPE